MVEIAFTAVTIVTAITIAIEIMTVAEGDGRGLEISGHRAIGRGPGRGTLPLRLLTPKWTINPKKVIIHILAPSPFVLSPISPMIPISELIELTHSLIDPLSLIQIWRM